jgi:hypothetical protein
MRNAYEKARLEASEISDREKLAAYWLTKVDWFSNQLTRVCQIAADLEEMHIPVPLPLSQARRTLLHVATDSTSFIPEIADSARLCGTISAEL